MDRTHHTRRTFLKSITAVTAAIISKSTALAAQPDLAQSPRPAAEKPNFIIVFTDDQGYQDVGCYGSPLIRTPRLDRMAAEGVRFTDFYAQTVCGPSRAALMTGCYPLRVAKKHNRVDVHPMLHAKEITIAEILKTVGYTTACFGKWDLAAHRQAGFDPELLPTKQGFDYFFGTPTSNDSVVNLLRNEMVIEKKADMSTLTKRYTDEAIKFIRTNSTRPFFVYIPHTMPHTKLAASEQFRGKSRRGIYGDVIEEIDYNTGRILDTITDLALDHNTYVIFLSDNGPWAIKKDHGGASAPLRGAKTSTWEGGLRVPCIMRAPGKIPPATLCRRIASTMDILPTLASIAGAKLPTDRTIDGRDIAPLIHNKNPETVPERPFFYYQHTHLQAVRSGKWKLHLPRPANPPWTPNWAPHIDPADVFEITEPLLYNLETDIAEAKNIAAENPKVVKRLLKLTESARNDIGDYNHIGKNARFYDPQPKRPDTEKWLNK